MIYAQTPDPTTVMDAAARTGDWVVVLLCFLVLAIIAGFFFLARMVLKQQQTSQDNMMHTYEEQITRINSENDERTKEALEREKRMTERINRLEDLQNTQMRDMIQAMTDVVTKVNNTLSHFSDGQKEINGDLKHLCKMLEVSPCLVMSKGRGRYKLVDTQTGEKVEPVDLKMENNHDRKTS